MTRDRESPADISTQSAAPDESVGLAVRARSSAAWTIGGFGGAQLLRLVSNLVLTRLLFQEAFGLMALMQVILQGLNLLSDIGIGPSLIHNERRDRRFVDTAFSISALRGLLLFALGCLLARPVAAFYEEPRVELFLPFIAFTALINGLESTKNHTLNRDLQVERIQIIQLGAQLLGTISTIAWALVDPSLWALIAGVMITGTSRLVLGHLYLRGPINRFSWDPSAARALFRYGRWVFLGTCLSFLAEQSDRLVFGKLISLETLGVYAIAVIIASLPFSGLAQLSWKILFPYFSRLREGAKAFSESFVRIRTPVFVLGGWALSGLIAAGPSAVRLLYDERYHGAGWMVQILSVAMWFQLMGVTNDAAAWGRGRPQLASIASLGKLVALAIFIPVGFYLGAKVGPNAAFPGAVVGIACADITRYLVSFATCTTLGLRPWRQDGTMTALVLTIGAFGAWLELSLRNAGLQALLVAPILFCAVSLCWFGPALPLLRQLREQRARRDKGI